MSFTCRLLAVIFSSLATLATAKFTSVYKGIATEGLAICTANMTREEYTARNSSIQVFQCVMGALNNYEQAILSSGASILGFIPTVLALLGCSSDQLLRLHAAGHPLLAFLLSITNIGITTQWSVGLKASTTNISETTLGAYTNVLRPHSSIKSAESGNNAWKIVCYTTAMTASAGIIWQTYDLGVKGVVSWACWTSFYPAIWLSINVLQHLSGILCMRVCLRDTHRLEAPVSSDPSPAHTASWIASIRSASRKLWQKAKSTSTSIVVWDLDLTREEPKFELRYPLFASSSKVCIELLNNANFAFGTAVFSSMALVSGQSANKVLCVYALVSAVTRVMVAWVLDD